MSQNSCGIRVGIGLIPGFLVPLTRVSFVVAFVEGGELVFTAFYFVVQGCVAVSACSPGVGCGHGVFQIV